MSPSVAVPLDPTLVKFLRADFHRGAIDVWLTVADRPLEEGIEALSKFFEDKERKIRGAYHETMDKDDDEDDDEDEEDEKLLAKDVKHASDEQVSTEDEQERWKARISANFESLAKEDSYRASSEAMVLLVDNVLEEREEALCSKVFIPKESKVSSEVKDYDEDEETAVETGKSLADEKKNARNEEMGVSVEGEKEGKKARMEESPCCKGLY